MSERKMLEDLREILDGIWKGGKIPEEQKIGTIKPIFKKGKKEEVENYRDITLIDKRNKIYT